MNGNVQEWLETTSSLGGISTRAITGGTFFAVPTFGILPEDVFFPHPLSEDHTTGFRFAGSVQAVPEPGSIAFVALAVLSGLVAARRRRK
jgi:hypothetical protein